MTFKCVPSFLETKEGKNAEQGGRQKTKPVQNISGTFYTELPETACLPYQAAILQAFTERLAQRTYHTQLVFCDPVCQKEFVLIEAKCVGCCLWLALP